MSKAIIIYLDLDGKTGYFSFKIGEFLARYNVEVKIVLAGDIDFSSLDKYDFCLIGCPNNGYPFLSRARYSAMRAFCNNLYKLYKGKILFFTTYSMITGLIFCHIKKSFEIQNTNELLIIKSKTSILTESERLVLEAFIGFNNGLPEKTKINQMQCSLRHNKNAN